MESVEWERSWGSLLRRVRAIPGRLSGDFEGLSLPDQIALLSWLVVFINSSPLGRLLSAGWLAVFI